MPFGIGRKKKSGLRKKLAIRATVTDAIASGSSAAKSAARKLSVGGRRLVGRGVRRNIKGTPVQAAAGTAAGTGAGRAGAQKSARSLSVKGRRLLGRNIRSGVKNAPGQARKGIRAAGVKIQRVVGRGVLRNVKSAPGKASAATTGAVAQAKRAQLIRSSTFRSKAIANRRITQ